MAKLSFGCGGLFDPAHGYVAIPADVARHQSFDKISHRYFFATDMLFRLNMLRATVVDIPIFLAGVITYLVSGQEGLNDTGQRSWSHE